MATSSCRCGRRALFFDAAALLNCQTSRLSSILSGLLCRGPPGQFARLLVGIPARYANFPTLASEQGDHSAPELLRRSDFDIVFPRQSERAVRADAKHG